MSENLFPFWFLYVGPAQGKVHCNQHNLAFQMALGVTSTNKVHGFEGALLPGWGSATNSSGRMRPALWDESESNRNRKRRSLGRPMPDCKSVSNSPNYVGETINKLSGGWATMVREMLSTFNQYISRCLLIFCIVMVGECIRIPRWAQNDVHSTSRYAWVPTSTGRSVLRDVCTFDNMFAFWSFSFARY